MTKINEINDKGREDLGQITLQSKDYINQVLLQNNVSKSET